MSDAIFQNLANTVKQINNEITEADKLIEFLRKSGETTSELDAKLKALTIRKNRYEAQLQAMGYSTAPDKI